MKRCLLSILLLISFFNVSTLRGQSFTVAHDTMYVAASGTTYLRDDITALTDSVSIRWQVVANTFPSYTYPTIGICDINNCYAYASIGMTETVISEPYIMDSTGAFSFTIEIDTPITSGTYYLTVRMSNDSIPTDTARKTYLLTFPTAVQNVHATTADISLFPNPAANELNINLAGTDADVVSICDITGKQLYNTKVLGNVVKINTEPLATGIYIVRILNSNDATIAIRRFVKQ